MMDNSLK